MKTEAPGLRRNILDALVQCSRPCDAYGLAKTLRETPMAVGRALFALERQGPWPRQRKPAPPTT